MQLTDDDSRYIEYLQTQLLTDDWKEVFDASNWSSWAEENGDRLRKLAAHTFGSTGPSLTEYLERSGQFTPATRYDLPSSSAIFEPILEEVTKAAGTIGLASARPVRIFTSTDISASPAARPTSADHLLFVGPGTSSFCNYWGKCVSAVTMALAPSIGFRRIEDARDLDPVFRWDPSGLILAVRLSLYYACFGTLLGFGEVEQPPIYVAYRAQLVQAMETFAIAHEYAHFVAEERLSDFSGFLAPAKNQELEFFCDELGLAISRECGDAEGNYLTFAGIGALVTFRVVRLCESVRSSLVASLPQLVKQKSQDGVESSHPTPEQRIEQMKLHLYDNTAEDQRLEVRQFVEEYDRILCRISDLTSNAISRSLDPGRDKDRGITKAEL
jgi:hypothetical protein